MMRDLLILLLNGNAKVADVGLNLYASVRSHYASHFIDH